VALGSSYSLPPSLSHTEEPSPLSLNFDQDIRDYSSKNKPKYMWPVPHLEAEQTVVTPLHVD